MDSRHAYPNELRMWSVFQDWVCVLNETHKYTLWHKHATRLILNPMSWCSCKQCCSVFGIDDWRFSFNVFKNICWEYALKYTTTVLELILRHSYLFTTILRSKIIMNQLRNCRQTNQRATVCLFNAAIVWFSFRSSRRRRTFNPNRLLSLGYTA